MSESQVYNYIFFTNVLRILGERNMTKGELAELSGVSISFLSDMTTGKGNPSLKTMERVADALETPLATLLETTDIDQESLEVLSEHKMYKFRSLPEGYERVCAVVSSVRAYEIRQWDAETKRKLGITG